MRGEHFVGSSEVVPEGGSSPHTRGTPPTKKGLIAVFRFIPAYAGNESLISARASCTTVHPRIRGERIQRSLAGLGFGGSSPHTRGTTDAAPVARPAGRFIPAYAGNEQTVRVARLTWPVHPRIRGERSQRAPRTLATSGSSPHTRGTIPAPPPPSTRSRFIPAYAGNAPEGRPHCPASSVHPRIRGERGFGKDAVFYAYGSSPHTRGTPHPDAKCRPPLRFIPAYAGNATTRLPVSRPRSVHPRIRGERSPNTIVTTQGDGSSPHTRGTRPSGVQNRPYKRFIPAYAGNARGPARQQTPPSVHPRIRGERSSSPASSGSYVGSSPHTRGTLPSWSCAPCGPRFIPAYAGNATWSPGWIPARTVHPRIRGERPSGPDGHAYDDGSSPHTRGTRVVAASPPELSRFIPAYAGNALPVSY